MSVSLSHCVKQTHKNERHFALRKDFIGTGRDTSILTIELHQVTKTENSVLTLGGASEILSFGNRTQEYESTTICEFQN